MKGVEPVSLDSFNDPFAHQVSWSPNKKGGYNFKTYKLNDIERIVKIQTSRSKTHGFIAGLAIDAFVLMYFVISCLFEWGHGVQSLL